MAIELGPAGGASAPTAASSAKAAFAGWSQRIQVADRIAFTEQLALLLETGVPLHTALSELHAQSRRPPVKAVLAALHHDILEGKPLSQALAAQPAMFPGTYTHLVAAAEEGGFLPDVLAQLKDLDEKAQNLRVALVSALTYPAVLLGLSVIVVAFILLWVFPRFADLFASIHDRLPVTTLVLMALSDFLHKYGALVVVGIGVLALVGRRVATSPEGRAAILSFHSGEDNRVARAFEQGLAAGDYAAISREPLRASAQECHDNPRARSAILRWAHKTPLSS